MSCRNVFLAVCMLALVSSARAQVLTARSSTLNYNYVYGAGADSHVGNDLRQRNTLLPSDSDQTGYVGSTSGALPSGTPYAAGVACTTQHEYRITGSLHEVESITASCFVQISASASGAGSAAMYAVNPGNEIVLSLNVQRPVNFRLTGWIALPGASPFSAVALQKFNGFNWEYVFYSAFLPTGMGSFDVSGTLQPAQYRISGGVSLSAGANEIVDGSYSYTLDLAGQGSCLADFNQDGFIDFSDFDAFIAVFEAGAAEADVNGDGFLDFTDFDTFVEGFELGCA